MEKQYNELTRGRSVLLPKTGKGKEKKLTAPVLESRQPTGVYCTIESKDRIFIGNYNTQTTFYDSRWEKEDIKNTEPKVISKMVNHFIASAPDHYLKEIQEFKNAKRKLAKFKPGDYFVFRISRSADGFGRVLMDIDQLKKRGIIASHHGLAFLMTKPVLVKIYVYTAESKHADINDLQMSRSLPSDYMMDNLLLYGQFEIIGYRDLKAEDLDFPMSYGRHINSKRQSAFLQWALFTGNYRLLLSISILWPITPLFL